MPTAASWSLRTVSIGISRINVPAAPRPIESDIVASVMSAPIDVEAGLPLTS
ncbi:Uncharacterised protein [Mycobacteroides abscessus subsp. abscessus]|nr:Uncharacterised protein [Mycobacteroides abscessus subsp. abscessus]